MALILLIGLALTGATVALIARAVAMPRIEVAARLGQIQAYGFAADAPPAPAEARGGESLIDKLALSVGGIVASRWKVFDETEIRKTLTAAGLYATTPMKFLGYRALAGVTLPLAMAWYLTAAGASGGVFIAG